MNPFEKCTTDAEIMKLRFELANDPNYTRQQLNILAAQRREEIKDNTNKNNSINLEKIIIPTESVFIASNVNDFMVFSSNAKNSTTFEFLGNGMVRF